LFEYVEFPIQKQQNKTDRKKQKIVSQQEFLDGDDSDDNAFGDDNNSPTLNLLSSDLNMAGSVT
jgi:hypothetical protein